MNFYRKIYRLLKKRKLKNKNFSIISNNCIAGIILHDLNLPFSTPTINLFIENYDFIQFAKNLEEYSNGELIEKNSCANYPIGILKCKVGEIEVHFLHYNSFKEAREKWVERVKRINYENLFLIMENPDVSTEIISAFNDLEYEKKVIITGAGYQNGSTIFRINNFYDNDYFDGKLFGFVHRWGIRRYLDVFNYIDFLNEGRLSYPDVG